MKKRVIGCILVAVMGISLLAGCKGKETEAVSGEEQVIEEEPAVGMANPMVEVNDDAEFEQELAIKLDSSEFSKDVTRYIVAGKIAEVSFEVTDPDGNPVRCTLRVTKDDELKSNPIEGVAGIYGINDADTVSIDMGNITITKGDMSDDMGHVDVGYWDYDDMLCTFTVEGSISQMLMAELYDSAFAALGIENAGDEDETASKTVYPLDSGFDVAAATDYEMPATINDISEQDGKLMCDFDVYSMDLYDAVDVTTLKPGDSIVVDGEVIEVKTVEETTNKAFVDESGEAGNRAVYEINGKIEEGGVELISNEGGTFRYFGFDDYATYSKVGNAKLPISDDAVLEDHSGDYGGEDAPGVVTVTGDEIESHFNENADYYFWGNTKVTVQNGEVVKIFRSYVP